MKRLLFPLIFILLISCSHNKSGLNNNVSSPYKTFFNQVKVSGLTDTILVQSKTKIFGCGSAYTEYQEELNKKGLNEFYEKYGKLLPNLELTSLFEKNNNVKILWIDTGNEGEIFRLKDSVLHSDEILEKRLIEEKAFLIFNDLPKTLDSMTITLSINYKKPKRSILKYFDLSISKNEWIIDKEYE